MLHEACTCICVVIGYETGTCKEWIYPGWLSQNKKSGSHVVSGNRHSSSNQFGPQGRGKHISFYEFCRGAMQVLVQKCLGRRACTKCGRDFNLADIYLESTNGRPTIIMPPLPPPKECLEYMKMREDDRDDVIRKRIQVLAFFLATFMSLFRCTRHRRNQLKISTES